MSDPGTDTGTDAGTEPGAPVLPTSPGGARRKPKSRASGCLPVLVVLVVLATLGYFGVTRGMSFIDDQFGEPDDYPGPGSGSVSFQVSQGDSISQMGRNLKEQEVVASVDAFTEAAGRNPDATGIQVGFYELKREMRASDVVDVLANPDNIISTTVPVPEGLRVDDVVDILVRKTKFPRGAFEKVLAAPEKLGLPSYANGDPEGYLFPSTYAFGPDATPTSMLSAMVDRWEQAAADADLEGAAEELGYSPHELMTIASLVEAEGRGDDMPKIARVIYNRLEIDPNPAAGRLQIDATVNFALGRELTVIPTSEDLEVDSPYNTYQRVGLPPGPIEAPGDASIAAAISPVDGPWFFYVTVDLETGETKFTESYDEFLEFKAELQSYCENSSDRC